MKGIIHVKAPDYLADALKLSLMDFESEIKISSMVKLFELGKVSSGVAAKVLGMSRLDFLDLLSKYNVSVLNEVDSVSLQ
ncbi:UPF0175 family protein [Cryomorpha ignava]|uniref:UPF0175 family protein n=1 Tax=Cryomorpha ignava TaxID=101383 RepID=UPI001954ED3E|nr:UPF0175 family protein [Cryomorpha ignava]